MTVTMALMKKQDGTFRTLCSNRTGTAKTTAGAITKATESDAAVTRTAEKETRAGKLAEGHGQWRISSQCGDGRRSQLQYD